MPSTMSSNEGMGTLTFEHSTALRPGLRKKEKCRKFFQQIEPTFSVSVPAAPYTELQFLDNFDPAKDSVVRKKAREWVNKNKEKTTLSGKPKSRARSSAEKDVSNEQEKQLIKTIADKVATINPRSVAASSIDPFGLLPDVGRNFDHIIKYFLSAQCPEEVPCSDDKYADKSQSQHSVVVFQRENTVLGNMANSELTFVLWLHATVSIRDGILGTFHTEEVQYFYNKALKTMKAAVAKASEDGEYPDNLLNAMACIMATANFSGMFKTAEIHRDALVRTLALRGDGDVMAGLKSTSHFTTKASQWCEMLVAAQNAEIPKIPYYPQRSAPLPSSVQDEAAMLTTVTLASLPTLSEPLVHIVQLLHQLGVGYARPPPHTKLDSFIIQPMYDAEHTLLRVLTAQKEPDHGFSQVEVLLTETFQLYFWVTTRRLPPPTRLSEVLISRLMKALLPLLLEVTAERAYESQALMYEIEDSENPTATADHLFRFLSHPREANNAITWALALGTFVTAPLLAPEQAWFKTHFKLQLRAMGLDGSEAGWRAFLGLFPSTEGFPWANMASLYGQFYT